MKEHAPHHLFWQGFWKGLGGFCAVGFCTWLVSRIPQWREPVITFALGLAPTTRAATPTSIALALSGFLLLVATYRHSRLGSAEVFSGTSTSAVPPQPIYSTLAAELEEPKLDSKAFHVLKWFSTFPRGSAPVTAVAQVCQMELSDALDCVKQLWNLRFIKTVVIAPGEWNGQYAITEKGMGYVRNHAT